MPRLLILPSISPLSLAWASSIFLIADGFFFFIGPKGVSRPASDLLSSKGAFERPPIVDAFL